MNDMPNQNVIEDIAIEAGIDVAYVEKDWFAVNLLKHIIDYRSNFDTHILFTGGTSLSKGYDLIERFSEDLDFLVSDHDTLNKSKRSKFKKDLIDYIQNINGFSIEEGSIKSFDNNKSFTFLVNYPRLFRSVSLRDQLKIEMKFQNPTLPYQNRSVRSFVDKYQKPNDEIMIPCVSPIEISGDKLSALSWRILNCKRNSRGYKPQIMRHLHDLAWLKKYIDESPDDFTNLANKAYESDQKQGGYKIAQMSFPQRLEKTLNLLDGHSGYKDDYNKYVLAMSYAKDDGRISYERAVSLLKDICTTITSKNLLENI